MRETPKASIEQYVDASRFRHADDSRNGGEHDLLRVRQFSIQDFALDFQADQKKEHCHEAIVDPQQWRHGHLKGVDLNGNRYIQQGVIKIAGGQIHDDHRQDGCRNQ